MTNNNNSNNEHTRQPQRSIWATTKHIVQPRVIWTTMNEQSTIVQSGHQRNGKEVMCELDNNEQQRSNA